MIDLMLHKKVQGRMRGGILQIHRLMLFVDAGLSLPGTLIIFRSFGDRAGVRYALGVLSACSAQHAFVWSMQRRTGVERPTAADALTLARMATGGMLAGLVAAHVNGRARPARWAACLMTLAAGSLVDWIDGPFARKVGPTRLGAVLDIEADSWLTLWSAAAAVSWRSLPGFCLVPPVMRYLLPISQIAQGSVPRGGGPWWSRATGIAQMALIIAALTPLRKWYWERTIRSVAGAVSTAQALTITVLLFRQLRQQAVAPASCTESNTTKGMISIKGSKILADPYWRPVLQKSNGVGAVNQKSRMEQSEEPTPISIHASLER